MEMKTPRPKRPWEAWFTVCILAFIMIDELWFWISRDPDLVSQNIELAVLQWAIVLAMGVTATGLLFRKAWAWWLATVGVAVLLARSSYHNISFLQEHGQALTLQESVELALNPMPLVTVLVLLIMCRIRGAYGKGVVGDQTSRHS